LPTWHEQPDTRRYTAVQEGKAAQRQHGFLPQQRDPRSQSGFPYSKHPHRRSQSLECLHTRIISSCECPQQSTPLNVSRSEHHPHRAGPACIPCSPESKRKRREPPEYERGHEDRKIKRGTGGAAGR
jgi:hypothetical protein